MSVQKLVAEADKLLEKRKFAEAILKLKQSLQQEPLNQLVATKLANAFVETQEVNEAAKVFSSLAKRLSDAGKSQVAIAIFKQALELTPDDIALRVRFAQECESVGKLGDAYLQAQIALQHYIPRKKYFDAAGLMPLICRAQPRDESAKLYWIEMLQMSQAETKVPHLLVALCGPPGLTSPEFSVGGDPVNLSESLYGALKKLVPYFPRDPKIAYAVAWCAYRRGRMKEFYHYLHECLRRDPDFCLGVLLFARVLSEEKRLNEAYFAFRHFKERMPTDKNVDMLSLNRQLESFIEKNGWVNFTEASQESFDPADFLGALTGEKKTTEEAKNMAAETASQERAATKAQERKDNVDLPPAEIELSLDSAPSESEVLLTDGKTLAGAIAQAPAAAPAEAPPPPEPTQQTTVQALPSETMQAEEAPGSAPAPPQNLPEADPAADSEQGTGDSSFEGPSVEFTGLIQLKPGELTPPPASPSAEEAEAHAMVQPLGAGLPSEPPAEEPLPPKNRVLFNPLANSAVDPDLPAPPPVPEREDRTAMFSPMDVLDAVKVKKGSELPEVKSRSIILEPKSSPVPAAEALKSAPAEIPEADKERWKKLVVEGERTIVFSPVEAVRAGVESRRPRDSAVPPQKAEEPVAPPPKAEAPAEPVPAPEPAPVSASAPAPVVESPPTPEPLSSSEQPTRIGILAPPKEDLAQERANAAEAVSPQEDMDRTREVPRPAVAQAEPATQDREEPTPLAPAIPGAPGVAFMPIPTPPPAAPKSQEENVDLGDDLLEGATRVLTLPNAADKTEHLLKEIQKDLEEKPGSKQSAEVMLRKADRYTAKRNYYLARKALRHAQALGAQEELVKERLRGIRKLEFPEALYNNISSDRSAKVNTEDVLHRLEQEFGLDQEQGEDLAEISSVVENQIEEIFASQDPRTILDFGVGLHEMGMFRLAEQIYQRVIIDFPDFAFDAYYLAAMAKLARKDYAGAASILKRLSADMGRSELEKIQIYYALGETFEKMQQRDRSKALFRKVAELDAGYRNVRHKLED